MADGQAKQNEKIVMRVSFYSMAANIALSIFKVLAGFLAHSGAMVSDGIHSASDVFSTVVVMVGYRLAGKESDENHQYGHERQFFPYWSKKRCTGTQGARQKRLILPP